VGALRFALLLYTLPISLFGLSVAAAELPELARLSGDALAAFLARVRRSLRQVAFLTIPTVVGYLAFGLLLVGALLRTGRFGAGDAWLVYLILAAYALGLLATTMARLLQNAFYALGDTATPARLAALRVGVSTLVAVPTMFALDDLGVARVTTALGLGAPDGPALMLGAVGLALGASVGAWGEWALLRRALRTQTDAAVVPWGALASMTGLAAAAALPAAALWAALPAAWPPLATAPLVTGAFAAAYLGAAFALDRPELRAWLGRVAG
jgi:putative peptidoglycan lipid II flippase